MTAKYAVLRDNTIQCASEAVVCVSVYTNNN